MTGGPRPSYASGTSTTPLLGETIGENLRRVVARLPDHEALVSCHQGFRATYRELWELTGLVARGLLARGVRPGDRVGLWSANRYEWVVTQYAAARVGAILVSINPTYRAAELGYVLSRSGTSVLLLSARFRDTDCLALVDEVRPDCPALREVVPFETGWDALVADGAAHPEAGLAEVEQALGFDDPINIQYTSGTTGRPKGATLSHHNVLNNGHLIGAGIGYTAQDRVCVPVPLFHCFGMVLGTLGATTHGATIVLPSPTFDPGRTLAAVQDERCTSLYGVPTMFIAMLEHAGFDAFALDSLRTGLMGGAPCPADLVGQLHARMNMRGLSIVCGMTETSPISTQTSASDPPDKQVATVGRPTPHVEVKIVDPVDGRVVPTGTPGEQCTRGYSVMLGYWDDEAATREAVDAAGWMHTGDLATIDDDGYVAIVGRIKDVIIRGGENIYPREVEDLLRGHPDVVDVQVIGVPDARYGEQVMAWVRLRDGAEQESAALAAHCAGRISPSKIPTRWRFTDAFPATASGKVQKFRMREIAAQELAQEVAAQKTPARTTLAQEPAQV